MKNKKILIILSILISIIIGLTNVSYATNDIVVMLDPGHGGGDPGTVYGNLYEKDVNWKIATKVKEILDNTPGITGILTRGENENPSIADRGIMARDNNADLLVSFHINSSSSSVPSGAEVYITGNMNQKRYHEYSNILGVNILNNLRGTGLNAKYTTSLRFSTDGELYEDGFLSDYYGIIRHPMYYEIPGILIEHCYITNPNDRNNFLLNDAKINEMAQADANAIIANKELFRRTYCGQINTVLQSIEMIQGQNGDTYIRGTLDIGEWVDDNCNKPKDMPQLTLKSTDGSVSKNVYSYFQQGLTYYFDFDVDKLDPNKEYYLEAYLTTEENIAPTANKTQKVLLTNKTYGQAKNGTVSVENNNLYFTYSGEIANSLNSITVSRSNERLYIIGSVKIEEIINGSRYIIDSNSAEVTLESTDGTYAKKVFSYSQGNGNVYFDTPIDELDSNKEYKLITKVNNKNNIAEESKKQKQIELEGKTIIGDYNDIHLLVENNNFKITKEYKAIIDANIINNISMNQNGEGKHYISGNMQIKEKVDGTNMIPTTLPELTLKTEDGYTQKMYIYHSGNGNYYFDTYIEDLDKTKEYYIEAKLTNENNIETEVNKAQKVILDNITLGKIGEYKTIINNSNICFIDASKYIGKIETKVRNINMSQNAEGRHYIYGDVQIQEIIDGKTNIPQGLPELTLKTEDGYTQKMYIHDSGNGSYYFDTYIEDLDQTEKYTIEARLTSTNNIAEQSQKVQTLAIENKELGIVKENKAILKNNQLQFTDGKYQGTISTKLLDGIYLRDNGAGRHYICGDIQIKETIDGETRIPETLPELTLKTDNGYAQKMYINHSGNGRYYFDTYIEDLDNTKQYYIEARLSDKNNIATESEKTKTVALENQKLGKVKGNNVIIENNKLQFSDGDKYQGTISTKLLDGIYLRDNGAGRHYICGDVQITEIVDEVTKIPETLPELTLKTEDGYTQKMYINHSGNGRYYFDTYIEDLDNTKQYYIEVKLADKNNIAAEKNKTQNLTLKNQELGETSNNIVTIVNNKICLQQKK